MAETNEKKKLIRKVELRKQFTEIYDKISDNHSIGLAFLLVLHGKHGEERVEANITRMGDGRDGLLLLTKACEQYASELRIDLRSLFGIMLGTDADEDDEFEDDETED